jgi:hypothetical protein
MKRWIVLLLAGLLLASTSAAALADPLHVGGGPMMMATGSPSLVSLPPQAMAPYVANPASVVAGGSATLCSPLHVGGGPWAD